MRKMKLKEENVSVHPYFTTPLKYVLFIMVAFKVNSQSTRVSFTFLRLRTTNENDTDIRSRFILSPFELFNKVAVHHSFRTVRADRADHFVRANI